MAFKDMLKFFREREGWSQSELATKLGLSSSTISMYEVGKREPSFEIEERIADLFNTDLNTLRGNDIEAAPTPPPSTDLRLEEIKRYYNALNDEGRARLLEQAEMFYKNNKYKEVPSSRKETG